MSPWKGLRLWGQLFWCREGSCIPSYPHLAVWIELAHRISRVSAFAKGLMEACWTFCSAFVPIHRPSATTTCMWGREMSTWNTNRRPPTPRSSEAAINVLIEHASQGKQNVQFYLECFMSNVQRSISIHDIDLSFSYEFHRFPHGDITDNSPRPSRPLSTIRTTSNELSSFYVAWAKSQFSSPALGWSPTGRSASTVATFPRSPLSPHTPVTDESIHIATKFVGGAVVGVEEWILDVPSVMFRPYDLVRFRRSSLVYGRRGRKLQFFPPAMTAISQASGT